MWEKGRDCYSVSTPGHFLKEIDRVRTDMFNLYFSINLYLHNVNIEANI